MRIATLKQRLVASVAALTLVSVGGLVLAQNAAVPAADPAKDANKDAKVDAPSKTKAVISVREMLDQSQKLLQKMQVNLKAIVKLQTLARERKDVIKLNCVNNKLLQIKGVMNLADAARNNLLAATSTTDVPGDDPETDSTGRYHDFSIITISEQNASVLRSEAENCIGEDLSFLGPTDVEVESGNEPDDPTAPVDPEFPEVETPPVGSPFI